MIKNFDNAIEWLTTLHRFGIKLGLEQTRRLCDLCGAPDRALRFIHLAGTNGKGSTGAMLESALYANNMVTGFYSSPHLISARERFRVNGAAVSENDFVEAAEIVRQAAEIMRRENACPTYFEATTVMAMLIFKKYHCDYVVWETGMGGRLDSTNIVTPEVAVITNIALDHEKFLGSTIAEIAAEKAGIIKTDVPVVIGAMPSEAVEVIRATAARLKAPFYDSTQLNPVGGVQEQTVDYQQFICGGESIILALNGVMQQRNAQIVKSVLQVLDLWNDASRRGLQNARWPARIELLCERRFLLDGGHNPDGLNALTETLAVLYPGKKFNWIFGAFADKDYTGGLEIIAPLAKSLRAVKFAEEARLSAEVSEICRKALALGISDCQPVEDLEKYLHKLALDAVPEEPVVIAGSLYLAGEVLSMLEAEEKVFYLH